MSRTSDEKEDRQHTPPEARAVRKLYSDGELWIVREVVPTFDRRTGASLVFESANVMRRLRKYPANWASLSDEELYALSCNIRR
jgi:hypothetical protein